MGQPVRFILDDDQINQHRDLLPDDVERDRLERVLRDALEAISALERDRAILHDLTVSIDPLEPLTSAQTETLLRSEALARTIGSRTRKVRSAYAHALVAYALHLKAAFLTLRNGAVERRNGIQEEANKALVRSSRHRDQVQVAAGEAEYRAILAKSDTDYLIAHRCELAFSAIESNVAATLQADWSAIVGTRELVIGIYARNYAERAERAGLQPGGVA